jgi:hypothetical protein
VIHLRRLWPAAALTVFLNIPVTAQQTQPATQQTQPAAVQAATPVVATPVPGTVVCPAPAPPAKAPERSFIAPMGMLLVPVLSTKVADFDKFLGYVRDGLAKTTDQTVQRQARGWKFFRLAEPGPNGDVVYAFVLDPAVPCVDYALGPILYAAMPDEAKVQEVMNLYRNSVRNGGTLMNLVPVPASK